MQKEKIKELFKKHSEYIRCYGEEMIDLDNFAQAINQAEKELKLEWYKKLLSKLEFIYDSDLNVFGHIIDKNANDYYKEIQNKIKELEK